MSRLRPIALPVVGLLLSIWLIYEHWIAPDPHWRWPKAEALGPILMAITLPYLVYTIYRAVRPYELVVGGSVTFGDEQATIGGTLIAIEGNICVVRALEGDYRVDRHAITAYAPLRSGSPDA